MLRRNVPGRYIFRPLKELSGVAGPAGCTHVSSMETGHQQLPPDCTCNGEGLEIVRRVPRVGAMPELATYRCEACGHVETREVNPNQGKRGQ